MKQTELQALLDRQINVNVRIKWLLRHFADFENRWDTRQTNMSSVERVFAHLVSLLELFISEPA